MLNDAEKKELCAIVRQALAAAVGGSHYAPAAPAACPGLLRPGGCFVTYKTHGELRGCIGCFVSEKPLWQTVAEYARVAALEDPRFNGNRLRPAELPQVDFDVSVLSPLAPCHEPEKIVLGTHGIYVRGGGRSGCFLPQVAAETGWSVEEFWGYCCAHKAGLPYDFWRTPAAELYTFTAEVIAARYAEA